MTAKKRRKEGRKKERTKERKLKALLDKITKHAFSDTSPDHCSATNLNQFNELIQCQAFAAVCFTRTHTQTAVKVCL